MLMIVGYQGIMDMRVIRITKTKELYGCIESTLDRATYLRVEDTEVMKCFGGEIGEVMTSATNQKR